MTKENDIEHWITDWSGVISDDRAPVYMVNIALSVCFDFSVESFQSWLSGSKSNAIEYLRSKGVEVDGNGSKIKKMHKDILDYVEENNLKPIVYPQAEKFFNYLEDQDISISVVSSHPQDNVEKEMVRYGFEELVDRCIAGCDDKVKTLKELSRELGEEPENLMYCGDMVNDIRASKEAGLKSAAVATGYHSKERLKEEGPDLMAEDLEEMMKEIERYEKKAVYSS